MVNFLRKMFNPLFTAVFTQGEGQPITPKQDFETMVKEGYCYNAESYSTIKKVYESTASIPYKLIETLPDGEVRTVTNHKIIKLLKNPNDYQTETEFREAFIAYYLTTGNSFIQPLSIDAGGAVLELHVWRPDKIRVIQGNATRPVAGYQYQENGILLTVAYDQFIHWRTWNPLEWWYGMSPITAASYPIDLHSEYSKHNFNTIKRGARSPVFLEYIGKLLKKEQVEAIRDTFDTKYGGADNAGKTPIAHGGLTLRELPSMSPIDMDWIDGLMQQKRQINTVWGVPSELLNDADAKKYGNFAESRRAFYMETCIPLAKKMYGTITRGLVHPHFGKRFELVPDIDKIEGIQGDRAIVVDKVVGAMESGLINRDEGRTELGY